MAVTLNIDLGVVILVGLCVAAPASFFGWLYANYIDRKLNIPVREAPGLSLEELGRIASRSEEDLPGFWVSMTPILLPVMLIASNTIVNTVAPESELAPLTAFLGNPSVALLLAAVSAAWVLAKQKGLTLKQLSKPIEEAISSAGVIILITAGGGAFGGMLVLAGVGDALGGLAEGAGLSLLLLGFLLAVLFKVAQGSGTVCMITVSSIMAPMLAAAPPAYHAVYILMAVGSGAQVGAWMNDSGFWVYRTMTGLTEIESLKTKSAMLIVMGFTGFLTTLLMSWLLPLT